MSGPPDVRLIVRAKNARMLRAIEAAGFVWKRGPSMIRLARACGWDFNTSGYQICSNLVNFRKSPLNKRGGWSDIALTIATALHVEPDELWPDALQHVAMKRNEVEFDVTVDQFAQLASGEAALIDRDQVKQLLDGLKPQHRAVLELRYGLNGVGVHTFEEIADEFGWAHAASARQTERNALRIIRRRLGRDVLTGHPLEEA